MGVAGCLSQPEKKGGVELHLAFQVVWRLLTCWTSASSATKTSSSEMGRLPNFRNATAGTWWPALGEWRWCFAADSNKDERSEEGRVGKEGE